jgi:DNA polymerase Ligase (LigD)
MPRFVLLYHAMPADASRASHWDLMLEENGSLLTWACPELPTESAICHVEQLPNHRLDYLEYEGPVSNQRGTVTRVWAGEYTTITDARPLAWHVMLQCPEATLLLVLENLDAANRWKASFTAQ